MKCWMSILTNKICSEQLWPGLSAVSEVCHTSGGAHTSQRQSEGTVKAPCQQSASAYLGFHQRAPLPATHESPQAFQRQNTEDGCLWQSFLHCDQKCLRHCLITCGRRPPAVEFLFALACLLCILSMSSLKESTKSVTQRLLSSWKIVSEGQGLRPVGILSNCLPESRSDELSRTKPLKFWDLLGLPDRQPQGKTDLRAEAREQR